MPYYVTVGGKKKPLKTSENKPAKDCCCGTSGCNAIVRSICSDSGIDACGYRAFVSDNPGDPPDCPPRFFRKKTVTVHAAWSRTATTTYSEGSTYTYTSSGNYDVSETREKTVVDGTCQPETVVLGDGSMSVTYVIDEPGASFTNTCTADRNSDTGEWSGETCIAGDCNPNYPSGACTDYPEAPLFDMWQWWDSEAVSHPSATQEITVREYHRNEPYSDEWSSSLLVADSTLTVTVTLSEEIDMSQTLERSVCDEEACHSSEELPDCRYCCTDRGGDTSGMRFLPDEPEGCIIPGSSATAWDTTPCGPSAEHYRSGQSADITFWFRDLVPGQQYRISVLFKRCEWKTDTETGNHMVPTCSESVPCAEGVDPSEIAHEIVFVAEHWAEILGRCGRCDVEKKRCELEDEAAQWNSENTEESPRSVGCTTAWIDVPSISNHYTWLDSCALFLDPAP